jgi:hypothetical protein
MTGSFFFAGDPLLIPVLLRLLKKCKLLILILPAIAVEWMVGMNVEKRGPDEGMLSDNARFLLN